MRPVGGRHARTDVGRREDVPAVDVTVQPLGQAGMRERCPLSGVIDRIVADERSFEVRVRTTIAVLNIVELTRIRQSGQPDGMRR